MAIDPALNGENSADLRSEIERLRTQLAQATADATRYRQAAYALLNERVPYTPPTEEELNDLLHGTRGQPLTEVIDELERELLVA
jgi:hypothetical protein